jgi:hypothetical protein
MNATAKRAITSGQKMPSLMRQVEHALLLVLLTDSGVNMLMPRRSAR